MGQCSTHHLLLFCQPTYRTFIKACQEVQTQMRLISYNRVYTYFRPAFACILIFGKTHFDGQLLTNSIVIVCWLKWPLVPSGDKQWQILLLTTPIRDLYVHSNTTLQAQQLCREVGCLEVLAKPACMISTSSTNPSTLPNPRLLSPYTLLGIIEKVSYFESSFMRRCKVLTI